MRFLVLALALTLTPGAATAQEAVDPAPRSLSDRYVDALAGTWAMAGIVGAGGALIAAPIGCSMLEELETGACLNGAVGVGSIGLSFGWTLGAGIGATLGSGIDPGLGFAVYWLGLLTGGIPVALGAALGSTGTHDTLSNAVIAGGVVGALAMTFLTPLYAVLLAPDAPSTASTARGWHIVPYVNGSSTGGELGVQGAF